MPHLERRAGMDQESCPDAESLCAYSEGVLSSPMQNVIGAHLARCPECAHLHQRLLAFAKTSVPAQEAEWTNAEKRLKNWMGAFLDGKKGQPSTRARSQGIQSVPRSRRFWESPPALRLQWAIGTAALLALMIGATLFLKPWSSVLREETPAVQSSPKERMPGEPSPSQPEAGSPIAPESAGPLGGVAAKGTAPVQTAKSRPPANGLGNKSQEAIPLKGEKLQSSSAPVPLGEPGRPVDTGTRVTSDAVRVGPGVALLVRLDSVEHGPQGVLSIRGTLSQPVSQNGTLLLPSGCVIRGSGMLSEGQASLRITDLDIEGRHYSIKGTASTPNTRIPSVGGIVLLSPGRLVEVWSVSEVVYERTAGSPRVWQVPKPH